MRKEIIAEGSKELSVSDIKDIMYRIEDTSSLLANKVQILEKVSKKYNTLKGATLTDDNVRTLGDLYEALDEVIRGCKSFVKEHEKDTMAKLEHYYN